MTNPLASLPINGGLILGLGLVGCATAGLITGHLPAADFMTVTGFVAGAGGAVTAVHVTGNLPGPAPAPDPSTMAGTTGTAGTV